MSPADTGLLVIDVQEKLIGLVPGHKQIVWNIRRLIDGAKILQLPVFATEQYPQGLGPTTVELRNDLVAPVAKLSFSCVGSPKFRVALEATGLQKLLLAGIETHVCVEQTALDLMAEGYRVYVAVDGTGARHAIDHEIAIRRMDSAGVTVTTAEAALFEWCAAAGTPQFKAISALVRQQPPKE
jgi:nicotinamidase-related amidase